MTGLREFTESVGQAVLGGVGRVASRVQERKPLPSDLLESDDAYLVVFDAPGAEMEDVQVRYEDGVVRVRIERFREFHEGYEMLFPGRGLTLEGAVDLPEDAVVDPRAASATLTKTGTLRVEVPKVDAGEDEDGHDEIESEDEDAPVTIDADEEGGEEATEEAADAAEEADAADTGDEHDEE